MTARKEPAVFRGGTHEVEVPVIVRDDHGHAVEGLRSADFRLFDRAKAQVISRVSVLARNLENKPDGGNQIPSRFLAYLLDNTNWDTAARDAMVQSLNSVLGPADRAAILATQGGLRADFTDDRLKLAEAFQNIPMPNRTFFARRSMEVASESLEQLGRQALEALRETVRRTSAMPGGRTIVLISGGFLTTDFVVTPDRGAPVTLRIHLREEVNELIQQAIRSHIVINCLDPRGLPANIDKSGAVFAERTVLAELSSGTGGILFKDDNDFNLGFRKTAGQPEQAYVIAFAPQNLKYDGSFHALRVNVVGHKNVEVQARAGYFAPRRLDDPIETAKEEIREAMLSREEIDDLPADVHTAFTPWTSGKSRIAVQVHVDLKPFRFQRIDNRNAADWVAAVGLFDRNGLYVEGSQTDVRLRLKDENLAQWIRSGISIGSTLEVGPGTYLVRVVVRDRDGGVLAAHNAAVEIK